MNALEERRERVAYAKSLGVSKPSTLKKEALEDAISQAEVLQASKNAAEDARKVLETPVDEDPFFDDSPDVEHGDAEDTLTDRLNEREATREAWLLSAVDALRGPLAQVGAKVPSSVSISVGFGSKNVRKRVGECWPTRAANGGTSHIFVSPVLEDELAVLSTVAHELIHASDDCESGHTKHFAQCAKRFGFTGKMTATTIGPDLEPLLKGVASELGPYPHIKLNLTGVKKQTTRLLKGVCSDVECPLTDVDKKGKATRYTIRLTQKWVEVGMPSCPCGAEMSLEGDEE